MTARSLEIFANMDQTTAAPRTERGRRRPRTSEHFLGELADLRFANIEIPVLLAWFLRLWVSLINHTLCPYAFELSCVYLYLTKEWICVGVVVVWLASSDCVERPLKTCSFKRPLKATVSSCRQPLTAVAISGRRRLASRQRLASWQRTAASSSRYRLLRYSQ